MYLTMIFIQFIIFRQLALPLCVCYDLRITNIKKTKSYCRSILENFYPCISLKVVWAKEADPASFAWYDLKFLLDFKHDEVEHDVYGLDFKTTNTTAASTQSTVFWNQT